MKYVTLLVSLSFLIACNQQQLEDEISLLKSQNELIREQSNSKNQFIEEYATTLNDVYADLEKIREREGIITEYSKTLESGQKTKLKVKLLNNIKSIDGYINRSKIKINTLKSRFNESELASRAFEQSLEKLTKELQEKELYIAKLREDVDSLNQKVADADLAIKERDLIIEEQTDRLNLAYYVIGTDEELEIKNIITEKGGLLGLFGKTTVVSSKLKMNDFNITDITETTEISINQPIDYIEIISEHNPDSYELIADSLSTKLAIKDAEEFWKMRYLVITTDD